jgi:NAD(P)-dependent dehydrogenase (short-subunit alcohol dehydrogenase family)
MPRTPDFLQTPANDFRMRGGTALEVQADIGNPEQVSDASRGFGPGLGEPEVLLFNAAAGPFGNIDDVKRIIRQLYARQRSPRLSMAKECAPAMVARRSGVMLFTGATAGVKAGARSIAFGAENFAKRGLVQSLARDLGPKGIHVA